MKPSKDLITILNDVHDQIQNHLQGRPTAHWFRPNHGLCCQVHKNVTLYYSGRTSLCLEFFEWLAEDFGETNYPFDGKADEYRACDDKYTNPKRVEWLANFLKEHRDVYPK